MTMSTNLQKLLHDALLNNTYDYTVVHDTLKNTWANSYSYLYELQKAYIEYEMHTYISNNIDSRDETKIGHLYINKYHKACFDIDYDFIHVSDREEFKRSDFFMSSFTFDDMCNNPDMFNKIPVIMIDGKAIWDYTIQGRNGNFTIVLPFDKSFVLRPSKDSVDEIEYLDHTIQVFIVDNVLYDRITITKNKILNTVNKTVVIDTSMLSKPTNKEGIYFVSVHIPDTHGNNYELGTILMPCIKTGNKLICILNEEDYNLISNHTKNLYVSVVFMNQLHSHTFYTGNDYTVCENNECNLCILQRENDIPYAMPIPVENLLIIKERNGVISYIPSVNNVQLFYPNIYKIIDETRQDGDKYYIYYFYRYAESLKYTTIHHDFYYDFLKIHFNNEPIEKIVDSIYHGKFKYVEDLGDDIGTVYLNAPDAENSDVDYILVCSSETQTEYVIHGVKVTPAIVNEAFINTFNRILNYNYYKYN